MAKRLIKLVGAIVALSSALPIIDEETDTQKSYIGSPDWKVSAVLSSPAGDDVITIKCAGSKPDVTRMQEIELEGLSFTDWAFIDQYGEIKHGVTFRADKISTASDGRVRRAGTGGEA